MKKLITFLVTFAVGFSATATPQGQTMRLKDLVSNTVETEFSKKFKLPQKALNTEFQMRDLDENTIEISYLNQTVKIEQIDSNRMKINGYTLVIEKEDSAERILQKVSKAIKTSQYSWLEQLFIPQADADITLSYGVALLATLVIGGIGWLLGRNYYRRQAAAQASTPSTVPTAVVIPQQQVPINTVPPQYGGKPTSTVNPAGQNGATF